MAHRNDDKHTAEGGAGHIVDNHVKAMQGQGATSGQQNTAEQQALVVQLEPIININGMWFSWLGKAPRSLVGALPDRFKAYWPTSAN